jgi:phosphomevalonate kinase
MVFMEAFHRGDAQLKHINRSHMVLLPKKPGAGGVDAFRPICLQNCTMKILSQVLRRRLQDDISNLIDIN